MESVAYIWSRFVVEILLGSGCKNICYSPGFRDAPLVLAAARIADKNKELNLYPLVDERACAYFALGLIRATGQPAAIFCTSGTAAANFFPAVMEAYHSQLPLMIISADRPQSMHGIGANQTTAQNNIYSQHVLASLSWQAKRMEAASFEKAGNDWVGIFAEANTKALIGPIHLNIALPEPLLPEEENLDRLDGLSLYKKCEAVFFQKENAADYNQKELIELFNNAKRPLFLVGLNHWTEKHKNIFYGLAQATGAVVWHETAAGLDTEKLPLGQTNAAWFGLKDASFSPPDLIVQWGAPLTLRAWPNWREKNSQIKFCVVDSANDQRDPTRTAEKFFPLRWSDWQKLDKKTKSLNQEWQNELALWAGGVLAKEEKLFSAISPDAEPHWPRTLLSAWNKKPLPRLFLGNSMPIRDYIRGAAGSTAEIEIYTQRGLSGIDGNIAGVAGIAQAGNKPLVAILGDLTAFHDFNSLALLQKTKTPVLLILINNGGGEIFRVVGTKSNSRREELFTTPLKIDWGHAAVTFGLSYAKAACRSSLGEALRAWQNNPCNQILEFNVSMESNEMAREILGQF